MYKKILCHITITLDIMHSLIESYLKPRINIGNCIQQAIEFLKNK